MHREETIRTTDGTTITARIYEPEKKANKVTVIAPSAEVTQEHYYDIAVFLMDAKNERPECIQSWPFCKVEKNADSFYP